MLWTDKVLHRSYVVDKVLHRSYVADKVLNRAYVADKVLHRSYVAGKVLHRSFVATKFYMDPCCGKGTTKDEQNYALCCGIFRKVLP